MILMDTPRALPSTAPSGLRRQFRRTSHMGSTLIGIEGTAELLRFAQSLGLQPDWIQRPCTPAEHFDLFDRAIYRAMNAGAETVTPRDFVIRIVKPKRQALDPKGEEGGPVSASEPLFVLREEPTPSGEWEIVSRISGKVVKTVPSYPVAFGLVDRWNRDIACAAPPSKAGVDRLIRALLQD